MKYWEIAGGYFIENGSSGEKYMGEIAYTDIVAILNAMEDNKIKKDENIYDDFEEMKRLCENDFENKNRYASDFFNIYFI